jgi:hypothetical protein
MTPPRRCRKLSLAGSPIEDVIAFAALHGHPLLKKF